MTTTSFTTTASTTTTSSTTTSSSPAPSCTRSFGPLHFSCNTDDGDVEICTAEPICTIEETRDDCRMQCTANDCAFTD
ncbi:hypothetical protein BST61_g11193 [Cercospora zeina]